MSKSIKQVIEALFKQGLTKSQVLDVLASEYWIDSSITRYVSTI